MLICWVEAMQEPCNQAAFTLLQHLWNKEYQVLLLLTSLPCITFSCAFNWKDICTGSIGRQSTAAVAARRLLIACTRSVWFDIYQRMLRDKNACPIIVSCIYQAPCSLSIPSLLADSGHMPAVASACGCYDQHVQSQKRMLPIA